MLLVIAATLSILPDGLSCADAPLLVVDRVIETTPFLNSAVSISDAEGMTFVPEDDTLWLGDDNGDRIYEVDRASGFLLSSIGGVELAQSVELGGSRLAGPGRVEDIEALAYAAGSNELFVFAGNCCPTNPNLPTVFRLTRAAAGEPFQVETFQPLQSRQDFSGAARHPDGAIYVGQGSEIMQYDYETNTVLASIQVPGLTTIFGMGFSADGADLWVVTSNEVLHRVDWSTQLIVDGYEFDLSALGLDDPRAVDFVDGQIYAINGMGEHDLTVFDLRCQCASDSTGDGRVNVDDLVAVIVGWGPCGAPRGADVNGDGDVDVNDLVQLILDWGDCV